MTITYRLVKGSELTHAELDANFSDLDTNKAASTHNHDTAYAKLEGSFSLGATLTGAVTLTVTNGAVQYGTTTGATTWTFSGAAASGTVCGFTLELTNGGAFTQTWPASVKWDGDAAPTLKSSGVNVIEFYTRDGGAVWRGFLASGSAN